jgi:hypothetical protein
MKASRKDHGAGSSSVVCISKKYRQTNAGRRQLKRRRATPKIPVTNPTREMRRCTAKSGGPTVWATAGMVVKTI